MKAEEVDPVVWIPVVPVGSRMPYIPRMEWTDVSFEVFGGALVGVSLGLIGAGGAIISIPIFHLVLGHAMPVAKVEALAVTAVVAAFSGVRAWFARMVDLRRFAAFALPGLVGAWIGGPLGRMFSETALAILFASVALVAAWRMVARGAEEPAEGAVPGRRDLVLAVLAGLSVGTLTSLIGVGGGFLILPALVILTKLPVKRATGTSLLVIPTNAVVGLCANLLYDSRLARSIDLSAVAIVACCGVAGSLVGASLAQRLPAIVIRRIFAIVLVVVAAGVMWRAFGV